MTQSENVEVVAQGVAFLMKETSLMMLQYPRHTDQSLALQTMMLSVVGLYKAWSETISPNDQEYAAKCVSEMQDVWRGKFQ